MKDSDDVVLAVCRMPVDFQSGHRPPSELLRRSGYFAARSTITAETLVDCLSRHPYLVQAWTNWSEDKRTDRGWYLDALVVGYHEPGVRHTPVRFDDPVRACAEFVLREVESIADAGGG
jgi:hypothetical protein